MTYWLVCLSVWPLRLFLQIVLILPFSLFRFKLNNFLSLPSTVFLGLSLIPLFSIDMMSTFFHRFLRTNRQQKFTAPRIGLFSLIAGYAHKSDSNVGSKYSGALLTLYQPTKHTEHRTFGHFRVLYCEKTKSEHEILWPGMFLLLIPAIWQKYAKVQ